MSDSIGQGESAKPREGPLGDEARERDGTEWSRAAGLMPEKSRAVQKPQKAAGAHSCARDGPAGRKSAGERETI